nr:immunoglobulin light chain junction region [Macaca mulatta]
DYYCCSYTDSNTYIF